MAERSPEELEAGLAHVLDAPSDEGELRLIVRRPGVDERETLEEGALDADSGLVGDNWATRAYSSSESDQPNVYAQLTLMNSRVAQLIGGPVDRWPLAGDQLYVDFDLSKTNLPAGTRVAIGEAVVEISAKPHTGCGKFIRRFGLAAQRWVNSEIGTMNRLRGVNTRVVKPGAIRIGDRITKV